MKNKHFQMFLFILLILMMAAVGILAPRFLESEPENEYEIQEALTP
ncbi:MAG: hypothetical protein FWE05_09655 [Defluviitaleaceae bacterium]|nr:hypothetical protein [Defluviitaleaceae bacterium]